MEVGIIGGTGPAGQALAARLSANGHHVRIGSRDEERANTVAGDLIAAWPSHGLRLEGSTNEAAAHCPITVLATPWEAAVSTSLTLAGALRGKVLISMVNALAKIGPEFQALNAARGSIAASLQAVLPEVKVAAAFQHLPARELGSIDAPITGDVLICADSPEATASTADLVTSVPGLSAYSCGSLASAGAVEALTAVLLNVNIRYKAHVSLRLTGIGDSGNVQ